jgi:transposase
MEQSQINFDQVVACGCGLDVHKETIVATISGDGIKESTRTFKTFTSSLKEFSNWLKEHGITHVAMESTGVYWKPVFNILETDFEIILVNARHIKNVPGHKTDRKDSVWITKLLLSGLLKGSFIPPRFTRELRDLYRYKRKLMGQRVSECNRMHKVLECANIKLSSVVSDVFGASGWRIICAIIEGQINPQILAELAKGTLRNKKEQLMLALEGNLTDHHRFMMQISKESILHFDYMISRIDDQIDAYLDQCQEEFTLLQTIPGVNKQTAVAIIAEMGTDMDVFPTEHHLASWCGLCPGSDESAGKKKSEQINHGNTFLKTALIEAAWVTTHIKGTYLKAKFESLRSRRGSKKALVAIAHKNLIAAYFILKNKEEYKEPNQEKWQEKRKQAQIKSCLKRLHELGVTTLSQ